MTTQLDSLIKIIAEHFVFDERAYPELKGATEEEKLAFAIRHSALHFAKTAGKISAVAEDMDHGEDMDTAALKKDVVKSLANTLRLAELVGLTGEDLERAILAMKKEQSDLS